MCFDDLSGGAEEEGVEVEKDQKRSRMSKKDQTRSGRIRSYLEKSISLPLWTVRKERRVYLFSIFLDGFKEEPWTTPEALEICLLNSSLNLLLLSLVLPYPWPM